MEYLAEWKLARQHLQVKTNTSDKPNLWKGKLVNKETPVETALELEQPNGAVVVIPWHAVEYVLALDAHTDG